MNNNLKDNERALIKQVSFFKKRAEKLISEGKLGEEHTQLITTCETLISTVQLHAAKRAEILSQRENLKLIIKDSAECPKCKTHSHLKIVGIDTADNGWKCNKYKCRKCNIEFVWTRPNNPWDLVPFMERFIRNLEAKMLEEDGDDTLKEQASGMIIQINESLDKLRPVIEASDLDFQELQERDAEMDKIVNEFKMHLQIERIKMDADQENRQNLN